MPYIFRGRLCGYICDECPEPLARVRVRIYRTTDQPDVIARAVANPKETFAVLDDEALKAKEARLIAEADTDEQGNFSLELGGGREQYDGGAFEVDVYCGTPPRPRLPRKPPPPRQFTITTLQPRWRVGEGEQALYYWDYCLPFRFWCFILSLFGLWTICGRVLACERQRTPIAGVKVRAFDADWLQDDELGSAVTDINGRFRIDYLTEDFTRTPFSPFINLELTAGPDLYFRVESSGGAVLLNEPRSRGRQPDRENVGHCFCVELCAEPDTGGGVHPHVIPLWRSVGQYSVDPPDGEFTSEGTTTVDHLAFTGTVELVGALPNGDNPDALEYHFQVQEYNADMTALIGAPTDIQVGQMGAAVIGALEYWDWNGTSWVNKMKPFYANNPGATVTVHRQFGGNLTVPVNVNVEPGGWIKVPRINDFVFGGQGWFVGGSSVQLITLDTTTLASDSHDLTAPLPALRAGESVPVAKRSRKRRFKLFFLARKVVGFATVASNDLEKIAISNATYTQLRHPSWAGGVVSLRGACMLDIGELSAPGSGCNKISDAVTVLYTAYHPYLGSGRAYFEGNAPLPPQITLSISADGEAASGLAPVPVDFTAQQPCAFILWLEATLDLTSGHGRISDATMQDHIAFCKG